MNNTKSPLWNGHKTRNEIRNKKLQKRTKTGNNTKTEQEN